MSVFDNIYRHRMARIAAFAPPVALAQPAVNVERIVDLARHAHERHAAVALFPELCITGYSLDDLHHQNPILDAAEAATRDLIEHSKAWRPLLLVGTAVRVHSQLYNCALVIHRGRLLGIVPKSYLPNYREYYEQRWFAEAPGALVESVRYAGQETEFGARLLFEAEDLPELRVHVEICEDLWAPNPPSLDGALAGATLMTNLSASNVTIGKARERAQLCQVQSFRCLGAYAFAAAGVGESTTDLAWDGQLTVHELGQSLAQSDRFNPDGTELFTDIDLERIEQDRIRFATYRDTAARAAERLRDFRRVRFALDLPLDTPIPTERAIDRFPFVPNDAARLDEDCFEAYNIQVQGLAQRLRSTGIKTAVIGVSGGLDSTQALIVTARAFDRLGLDRANILAVSLPGFATSDKTAGNATALIEGLGVTHKSIDIRPAAERMLEDLDHPYSEGKAQYDRTFENVQAGLRTDYLFRLANHHDGLVVGTGDLSELALGWCTYGVGDQMAHYNVNAAVAKTLIQHLIAWVARREEFGAPVSKTLNAILETEISPELIPSAADEPLQSTESTIGPYSLQDFNLHHAMRFGLGPAKIAFLAERAWSDRTRGDWPSHIAIDKQGEYTLEEIVRWLEVFCRRFFQTSQFKRSAMPNGPKVTSAGALSPRGDWRMPSDSSARVWMDELAALRRELGLPASSSGST
ncbi:NAD(+) synthase [Marinicauda pacifica]|uniref:Glutamine-dependent NAD(+) synthetase n=1 Tax=Marinicauda pacifica TaxID=1133559 RepID=A0A4V6RF80_9PROT|nr:NAD(+) synthase [Marinicauda pacifica]TGY92129.1 NAD(+) synthase [Marinicauda pacifica]GGE46208.1 NAD(+) synthase [Marinicauda pacifica]